MRVVFLDIDGVLVTSRALAGRVGMKSVADQKCVHALNQLLEASNASLVISSAWRFCGLEEIRLILKHWGIRGNVIDITPDLTRQVNGVYLAVERGKEIQCWLDSKEGITSYVILDDQDPGEHWRASWICTVFDQGLTEENVRSALRLLVPLDTETSKNGLNRD